jgi:multicomponent K+:H+ antiporter subunit C
VNVFIFAMGRLWMAAPPLLGGDHAIADPLPQALVLTAIVIGFATTGFIIELALRARHELGTDQVDGQGAADGDGVDASVESGRGARSADSGSARP